MYGQQLSRRFYTEVVAPAVLALLGDTPHAAAMLGEGSDVLGYDDDISHDHDFGPKVQLVLPSLVDPAPVVAALARLPTSYDGYTLTALRPRRAGSRGSLR